MARRRAQHPAFDVLACLCRTPDADVAPLPPTPNVAPSAEDRTLFRARMAGVRPLPPTHRAAIEPPKPDPLPRQRLRDEAEVLRESLDGPLSPEDRLESGTEDAFLRPGLPRRALSDLRRGRWVIQAEIDLHGHTRTEARDALGAFIASCLARKLRCVRVIHGKGLSSPGGWSVLKTLSRQWLARREEILAFCAARPHDGGDGALIVLLRSQKGGAR
jgi:DNA-nicking Smr family endonuclease